ncbi:MAG: amidohydrolase family protein [Planctomycetota bacterium]|nr:amidohydrolase family protein [Planctomycetota bacterium]
MIIDLHTHVWMSVDQLGGEVAARLRADRLQHWGQLDASPPAHERAMSCVDGALVIGFRSDRLEAHIPNEYIADFVAKDPRRRIGAAGIDPLSPDAMDEFDAAIDLGLCAIAVSPACQGFHPAHSAAMRIYERCLETSMPLFVTLNTPLTASSELEFARPVHWDEVARAFPDLPIVISQLGHPWIDETLTLLGKHQNMWADISFVASRPWQLYHALLNALSFSVMDRLLFGSGFPHEMPARAIESLYRVNGFSHGTQLPAVPRAHIRGIVERDAIACLGIEPVFSARLADAAQREVETEIEGAGESIPRAPAAPAPPADDE